MAKKTRVDTVALQMVSDSLDAISASVNNIVDDLNTLIKMGDAVWKNTGDAGGIFTEKTRIIKTDCKTIAYNLKHHSSNLSQIKATFESVDNSSKKKTKSLDSKNIF